MNNKNTYVWFNIGQRGLHGVTWECAVINLDFDPSSIRFQDYEWNESNEPIEKWVSKEDLKGSLHKSVAMSFQDLSQVAEWVKESYQLGEDVYVGNDNWTHIYNVFDMDNVNEYGIGIPLWS